MLCGKTKVAHLLCMLCVEQSEVKNIVTAIFKLARRDRRSHHIVRSREKSLSSSMSHHFGGEIPRSALADGSKETLSAKLQRRV
jgi:hypothetical protein